MTTINSHIYGRLYTKDWVDFDLVLKEPVVFQIGAKEYYAKPDSAMFISPDLHYYASAPVSRIQIPLSYFEENDYFSGKVLTRLSPEPVLVRPDHPVEKAILTDLRALLWLNESEDPARPYLEPGILQSTFEAFQSVIPG